MSQEQAILSHLQDGNRLTPLEALHRFGCFRLGARVYDLRRKGYRVNARTVRTAAGKRVAEYWLEDDPA